MSGGGDWYGSAVNLAARLASHARPNEALISWSTRSASRQELAWPPRSRCEVFLRGVEQPVSAWRLRA